MFRTPQAWNIREQVNKRQAAQKELGEKFDLRAFHDLVLGSGAVPLNILEQMVKDWVNKTKASQS